MTLYETKRRYRLKHRETINAYSRKWYKENRDKIALQRKPRTKKNNIKHLYGISLEEWQSLFDSQNQKCAICKTNNPNGHGYWCTDHDHLTGKVRGILCNKCNMSLGGFKDNVESLQNAATYLQGFDYNNNAGNCEWI